MLDNFRKAKLEKFNKHFIFTNPELALWAKNALMTPEGVMLMASAEAFIDDLISEVERAMPRKVGRAKMKKSPADTHYIGNTGWNMAIEQFEDNLNNPKL